MKVRMLPLLLFVVLVSGCASGGGTGETPGTANRPPLRVRQIGPIFFGSSYSAPVTLELAIQNDGKDAMTVWRLTVQDAGMVQYDVLPTVRDFRTTIAPGESATFNIVATATTDSARLNPTEPLIVRVTLDGDRAGTRFRSVYLREQAYE